MRWQLLQVFCTFCSLSTLSSQSLEDINWVIGQGAEIHIDFSSGTPEINLQNPVNGFSMGGTNISMSDANGELLFYSNGCDIRDKSHAIMENGDLINPGIVEDFYCNSGFSSPVLQGAICLPLPESEHLYYLFNLDLDIVEYDTMSSLDPKKLLFQVIDMEANGGLGAVIEKNKIAVEASFAMARGQLQAVKHANGRDWWIFIPKALSNCYYRILFDPTGPHPPELECAGIEWEERHGIGQAVFSPSGNIFARINPWNGLHIFDFDRCDGSLSNPVHISFPQDTFTAAGVSISPNSRYLYATTVSKLYQFDLEAADIASSKVLIDSLDIDNFPNLGAIFYQNQLAPDGKIYIAGISSHLYYHIISEPDETGQACNFIQQGLLLPALNFVSIPNFPNYDLEASTQLCDSTSQSTTIPTVPINQWEMVPQPAQRQISIQSVGRHNDNHPISLKIFTLTGSEVFSVKCNPGTLLEIQESLNGLHIYQIWQDGKLSQSGKILFIQSP